MNGFEALIIIERKKKKNKNFLKIIFCFYCFRLNIFKIILYE